MGMIFFMSLFLKGDECKLFQKGKDSPIYDDA
jgi:hypothetical protein